LLARLWIERLAGLWDPGCALVPGMYLRSTRERSRTPCARPLTQRGTVRELVKGYSQLRADRRWGAPLDDNSAASQSEDAVCYAATVAPPHRGRGTRRWGAKGKPVRHLRGHRCWRRCRRTPASVLARARAGPTARGRPVHVATRSSSPQRSDSATRVRRGRARHVRGRWTAVCGVGGIARRPCSSRARSRGAAWRCDDKWRRVALEVIRDELSGS
jgi:hypothetical protein